MLLLLTLLTYFSRLIYTFFDFSDYFTTEKVIKEIKYQSITDFDQI